MGTRMRYWLNPLRLIAEPCDECITAGILDKRSYCWCSDGYWPRLWLSKFKRIVERWLEVWRNA